MCLPQFRQLLRCPDVCLIERIFAFEVTQHFLVSDAQIFYFFAQRQNGLLHLVLLQQPIVWIR